MQKVFVLEWEEQKVIVLVDIGLGMCYRHMGLEGVGVVLVKVVVSFDV